MSAVTVPRPIVEVAVGAAFGPKAKVITHKMKTLTAPGDNFATTVVCLQVELKISHDTSETVSENTSVGVQTKSENSEAKNIESGENVSLAVGSTPYPNYVGGKAQTNSLSTKACIAKSGNGSNSTDQRRADSSPSTETWTCIAKTNSKKKAVFFKIFSKFAFDNEIRFYTILLPALNKELSKSKAPCLKISEYYFSHKEEDNELIIMEDLRRRGFTMGNKCSGLDSRRCMEVVKELARLHSASVLVKRNHPKKGNPPPCDAETASDVDSPDGVGCRDAFGKQDGIETRCGAADLTSEKNYLANDGPIINIFVSLVQTRITSALDLLSKRHDAEKEVAWLKSIQADIPAFLRRMLVECKPEFLVLCHGDTWTNNFLFSPNLDAVSMVDFQLIRPASLATDLNYLFYSSHLGYFTPINLDKILDSYYAEFTAIMEAQGYHMPFTRKALSAEVEAKKQWGVMGGVLTLPMIFPQQPQKDEESPISNKEMVTRNEHKANKNYVEERNKEELVDKVTRSDIEGTRIAHHSDPTAEQETSTAANVKRNSVDEQSELPCNSTFEEKFVALLKNITQ